MKQSDLLLLLRLDLRESFRVKRVKGSRTERKGSHRNALYVIGVLVFGLVVYYIVSIFSGFVWPFVVDAVQTNPGLGATIFNAILLFAFLSSIMVSATTVGNSAKMEYLLVFPVTMRSIFLEKTVIVVFYNSMFWLVLGVPIFLGLSAASSEALALLSAVAFVWAVLVLVSIGVGLGGLLGLIFSRLFAGRRTLKQVGYFVLSAGAIIVSSLWYYQIYSGDSGSQLFEWIFALAGSLGFSSDLTPGYAASSISLGLLVGVSPSIQDYVLGLAYVFLAAVMLYANSYVSEIAHYSGWLMVGSKRSSKKDVPIRRARWAPQSIPVLGSNSTISVSIWYNITSIRREGRVLSQYLIGPARIAIWIVILAVPTGGSYAMLTPFLFVAALIPFATSYGVYFAGYEIVYEGKNLMNLQLAAANMEDYIKGKIYSAVPFAVAASLLISLIIVVISPSVWIYVPALVLSILFINIASGGIAANAAAIGGDFKAERMILRQRGSSVQMPIRGWSILRAQLIPNLLGYTGVFAILLAGMLIHPLYSYLILPVFCLACLQIMRAFAHGAGVKLAQIESSKYL